MPAPRFKEANMIELLPFGVGFDWFFCATPYIERLLAKYRAGGYGSEF